MSTKVGLHVSNKKAYVWSPQDLHTLRADHHITASLIGTLPSVAQQNVFLGLPLSLMPEEVVYLLEKGLVVLLDDSTSHRQPTPAELQSWHEARREEALAEIQGREKSEAFRAVESTGKGKGKGKTSEAALQKRKEREERKARKAAVKGGEDAQGELGVLAPDEAPVEPAPESAPIPSREAPLPTHTIRIPTTSHPQYPWFEPTTYSTLSDAKAAGIWTYPDTPEERARCAVFRDLITKGYFLGGGMKFGGDWLVYPGDPLRYHSHFVATVFPTPTSLLRPMDIVAFGRLGTATKKAHLLCGWDQKTGEVDYYSIEWASFG
ncbi:hypothetical protein BOTBODRAFT_189340 [Botryobasidium botryosum FD-172 SS1]|uniref:tRNA-splicing endonuclease subunit Sen34 n=1 Tax=Botryobasidium botryosum (strain FD-172 SS1) TaxID=930990 RepID=A0A067MKI4_BOTB1|nr:hypothetical protein BOTBODRAFT_189340 [Botryobasidium botryosum FD-172 SS1]